MTPARWWAALAGHDPVARMLIDLRMPRLLCALFAGALLAARGVAMQSVVRGTRLRLTAACGPRILGFIDLTITACRAHARATGGWAPGSQSGSYVRFGRAAWRATPARQGIVRGVEIANGDFNRSWSALRAAARDGPKSSTPDQVTEIGMRGGARYHCHANVKADLHAATAVLGISQHFAAQVASSHSVATCHGRIAERVVFYE